VPETEDTEVTGAQVEAEVEVRSEPIGDPASASASEESPGRDSNPGDLLDFMFF